MWRVLGRVRASIHPDGPFLLVRADGLPDCDELMGDGISFLPQPHGERAAVDVLDDMDLALVLGKRKPAWAIGQTPLACVVIDREPHEFDKRRTRAALRLILVSHTGIPQTREIELSECGNAGKQYHRNN